jgi:Mor family transcriptional regulator
MVIDALTHYGEYVSAQYWDASGQKPSSHTVRKLFGSWAEAWAAAGLHAGRAGTSIVTTNDAPTHPLNDLDAQLWEERQHGQTLESLSERFGLSTSTIARRILRARVPSGGSRPTG